MNSVTFRPRNRDEFHFYLNYIHTNDHKQFSTFLSCFKLLLLGQVGFTTQNKGHDTVDLFNFLDLEVANIAVSVHAETDHDTVDLFNYLDLEVANIIVSVNAGDRCFGCQNRYYSW